MPDRYQYPFEDRFAEVDGVKLHYVDEGTGPPILMIHGQPTWSYLYRKMIPPLVEAGYRCIAPDLMGFGLSDKPIDESAYTLQRHVELITGLVEQLGLEGVTPVVQDWGGPIGLRYAIDNKENVRSLVILNTLVRSQKMPLAFKIVFRSGGFSSFLVRRADLFRRISFNRFLFKRGLDPEAKRQYMAHHPNAASRTGIAAFPKMIPDKPSHPNYQYINDIEATLKKWDVPVLVMFSDKDIGFKVEEGKRIAGIVPNGRFHLVAGAGHFLQEDAGEEISERMIAFLKEEAGVV